MRPQGHQGSGEAVERAEGEGWALGCLYKQGLVRGGGAGKRYSQVGGPACGGRGQPGSVWTGAIVIESPAGL